MVGIGQGSGEQSGFVWDLEPVLSDAGWKQDDWNKDTPFGVVTPGRPWKALVWASNVEIHLHQAERARLLPAAQALATVLTEIDIPADVYDGFNMHNDNPRAIHIAVGEKR